MMNEKEIEKAAEVVREREIKAHPLCLDWLKFMLALMALKTT